MALTTRNNNQAVMRAAASIAGPIVAKAVMSEMGGKLARLGVDTVSNALSSRRKKKKKNGNTDIVLHPGANAGAIAAPVAISRVLQTRKPKFTRGKGVVTITHSELVGEWRNAVALVVNQGITGNLYRVNPSNAALFPWLQSLASNFDQYMFAQLKLRYVPMCSTTETGRVAMYFDKDSQDPEPGDRVELSSVGHQASSSAWAEFELRVPCDNVKRFTDDSATTDLKLVDLGQLGIAAYGGAGTNVLGDVYIDYTISFFEPQPSSGTIQTLQTGTGVDTSIGPKFVTIGGDSISCVLNFRTPGTYLVYNIQRASTITGLVPSTGATLSSFTNLLAPPCYSSMATVVIDRPGAIIQYNGTGFGFRTTQVMRAKRANTSVILGQEANHFMSIVDLDGEFAHVPYQATSSSVLISHKSTKATVGFGPTLFEKLWKRVPTKGFYTPADVNFVITPHISESAGVLATVKLIDGSDMSPRRVLYQSKNFNLGRGLTLQGSQLPFCLPIGEYPILFEVTVLQSSFQDTRTIFSTSLAWRMMYSRVALSRVKSVFVTAQLPPVEALTNSFTIQVTKSKGGSTTKRKATEQIKGSVGGTSSGLVSRSCVGAVSEI